MEIRGALRCPVFFLTTAIRTEFYTPSATQHTLAIQLGNTPILAAQWAVAMLNLCLNAKFSTSSSRVDLLL